LCEHSPARLFSQPLFASGLITILKVK